MEIEKNIINTEIGKIAKRMIKNYYFDFLQKSFNEIN